MYFSNIVKRYIVFVTALLSLSLAGTTPATAETVNCTAITSIPHTISAPGIYCLTGNLSTSMTAGAAININASDVTLDLNGFNIDGSSAGAGSLAFGITVWAARNNVTIRNGGVKGFIRGVTISTGTPGRGDSSGHLVENIKATNNLYSGIFFRCVGSIARNNVISQTGGSTVYATSHVYALYSDGSGNLLENNIVYGTDATLVGNPGAYGISVNGSSGTVLRGNSVSHTVAASGGAIGIRGYSDGAMLLRNNEVNEANGTGVEMETTDDKYMGTITRNVGTAYVRGTAVGHNN